MVIFNTDLARSRGRRAIVTGITAEEEPPIARQLEAAGDHGKIPGVPLRRAPGEVHVGDTVCIDDDCPLPSHKGMCPDYTNDADVAALWKAEAKRCRRLVGEMAELARQYDNIIRSAYLGEVKGLTVKSIDDVLKLVSNGIITAEEARKHLLVPEGTLR